MDTIIKDTQWKAEVPMYYDSFKLHPTRSLYITEFDGIMVMHIVNKETGKNIMCIECYFEDIQRAWDLVK